ncbi:MAG: hypothetical protein L0G70_01080 [Rubrobacter sp.]|nr:hypothetical protein [Rubrobacter sp.]
MSADMNREQQEQRDHLQRVFTAADAVEFIQAAQTHLAAAGGFDATLDSLDQAISEIRAVTSAPNNETDDEDEDEQ